MEKFYKAYRRFAELLHSEQFCVNFKLIKGDIFSFDNRRVVHGRTEYDPKLWSSSFTRLLYGQGRNTK